MPDSRDDGMDHRGLLLGDERVLGEVYDAYAEFVYGVALRVTADAAVAEDVACEVFVALWERPYAYDPLQWSLAAWLVAAAHRRAVERVGRGGQSAAGVGGESPDEDAVAASLAGLAPDLRDVVELSYFQGLTYRQVAAKLGVVESVVAERVRIGLVRWDAAARDGAGAVADDGTEARS
ncbi:sigma factor [Streptodolium elevatio]|uniref:Sigma factor n=1 Tax=Streptodolium elevatio TaxID=3157996 RepID=A0ABV3DP43_9ACTN